MTPHFADDHLTVYVGDCRAVLASLPAESVHCVATSPPYWGLRDYGTGTWEGGDEGCAHSVAGQVAQTKYLAEGHVTGQRPGADASRCRLCGATRVDAQLGLERTPEEYVANMVGVFREVRRVLRPDGTLWLNLGDSYAAARGGSHQPAETAAGGRHGVKHKDLVGIPWRLAFALQADGWYLRSDIIWSKPNPMPESVTDRPTKSHEYVFLLARSARYFYDAEAVREPDSGQDPRRKAIGQQPSLEPSGGLASPHTGIRTLSGKNGAGRNLRSVWSITSEPYHGAHFATFPRKLVEPCIKAGTSERGVCPECGAPWTREVTRAGGTIGRGWHGHENDEVDGNSRIDYGSLATAGSAPYRRETTGWRPTCNHYPRMGDWPKMPRRAVDEAIDDYEERVAPLWALRAELIELWKREVTEPAVVVDPFAGSGTTGLVANAFSRRAVLIDLSAEYIDQAMQRNSQTPLGIL